MSGEATASFERRHPRALVLIRIVSFVVAAVIAAEIVTRLATYVGYRRGLSEFEDIRRRHDASRAVYPAMNVGVILGEPASFPGIIPVADGPPRVQPFGTLDETAFLQPIPKTGPAPGQVRIVFIGGSTTYDGYPAEVGARLAERFGQGHVEAINLGIPASNSATSLVLMKRFLPQLRPHVVVVYHGFNDITYYRARARAEGRRASGASDAEPAMFIERPSRGLLGVLFSRPIERPELPREAIESSTRTYEQMAALSRELGFKLFLSTFASPSYDDADPQARRFFEADLRYLWPLLAPVDGYRNDLSAYNANVRTTAPRIGAGLIDVAQSIRGSRNLFRDNCHTTVEGRAIHAAAVADSLAPTIKTLMGQPSP